jgi:uncharacterized protein (TIGR01777 family)
VRDLNRLFQYRHDLLEADLALHNRWASKPRRSILISGSSGLVGTALSSFLSTAGHTVYRLVRGEPKTEKERAWDPKRGLLDPSVFEGIDVVVHLGGEDISRGRWNAAKKQRITDSRVSSTALISRVISKLPKAPQVAIFASAVGFYGDTGENITDESSDRGSGFLAETCQAWEDASSPLAHSSTRLVKLRLGTVLSLKGGALHRMLLPFLAGFGGPLGSGKQYVSWIALQDLLGIFEHAIFSDSLRGPINAVSPHPLTNLDFSKINVQILFKI